MDRQKSGSAEGIRERRDGAGSGDTAMPEPPGEASSSFTGNKPPNSNFDLLTDDAVRMVEAACKLEVAVNAGYAVSYASRAMCGLANDTRTGYGGELRKLVARIRKQPGASAWESIDDQILFLVQHHQTDSALKKLLSGIMVLEKLRWIPRTVCAGDWLVVQAVESFREKITKRKSKTWASMHGFLLMCQLARGAADWERGNVAAGQRRHGAEGKGGKGAGSRKYGPRCRNPGGGGGLVRLRQTDGVGKFRLDLVVIN